MNYNTHIFSLLIVAIGFITLNGCNSFSKQKRNSDEIRKQTPVVRQKSVALFDYFSYKGEDKSYSNHPLTEAGSFYNPILPGWYSDPSICTNGEDYFLVTSTFVYYPGVPIFHSTDLVNWKQIGHVLDRPSQLENFLGQGTSGGIFAPAISYNPHNQTYYMITTNVGAGNFFVKTKDPFGSWSDPVYLHGVGGIDPSFFFDEDGRAYIVNNDAPDGTPLYEGHRAIRVCEFDVETEEVISPSKMIVNGGVNLADKPIWIEGPHIYKMNGRYLLMAAEGGTGPDHSEVVFSSENPMGPYTPWKGNPILTQRHLDNSRPNPVTCVGHADLIQTKEGDWWAVFLGCRPVKGKFENLGRETFLMPVRWSDDDFPYITQGDEEIPIKLKREGVTLDNQVTFGNFCRSDNFTAESLGMEWITLRSDAKDLYSLTQNPGFVTLPCIDISATEKKTPAFIARRLQHHVFEATTRMFFEPEDENDAAGLLLYKDDNHQYFFSVRKDGMERKVCLEKIGRDGSEMLIKRIVDAENAPVSMKITSTDGLTFGFYYTLNDDTEWKLLGRNIDAHYLSTAASFGFTGTTIGMYATKKVYN